LISLPGSQQRSSQESGINIRIFDHESADWRELQERVAQLFSEIGCDVIPRRTQLLSICECKFWSKPVPQEVIHSFRTVLSDLGAHRGFIIARTGFQAGAREAVTKTNLDLLTFELIARM
jgi:hypothetical protein